VSGDPLIVEFAVGVAPAHAFEAWTRGCAVWWPDSHTISGDPAAIVFEPRSGGRIFERGPDGREHDWGTVLEWQPPARLSYRWHLFFDAGEATEVELTFTEAEHGTAIRLVQHGWELLGAAGPPRRTKTGEVWGALSAAFVRACGPPRADREPVSPTARPSGS
jgi:uncharacterized protein YndB with AHSA1/START domain